MVASLFCAPSFYQDKRGKVDHSRERHFEEKKKKKIHSLPLLQNKIYLKVHFLIKNSCILKSAFRVVRILFPF